MNPKIMFKKVLGANTMSGPFDYFQPYYKDSDNEGDLQHHAGSAQSWRTSCSATIRMVLTRSCGGAWPRDAAVDTRKQAGRQITALTGASSRSCHVTKRFRILATLK